MAVKYYIDIDGNYIGAYNNVNLAPQGAIEVTEPPSSVEDTWNGSEWIASTDLNPSDYIKIGTSAKAVMVCEDYILPTLDGGSGQVIRTNGQGITQFANLNTDDVIEGTTNKYATSENLNQHLASGNVTEILVNGDITTDNAIVGNTIIIGGKELLTSAIPEYFMLSNNIGSYNIYYTSNIIKPGETVNAVDLELMDMVESTPNSYKFRQATDASGTWKLLSVITYEAVKGIDYICGMWVRVL